MKLSTLTIAFIAITCFSCGNKKENKKNTTESNVVIEEKKITVEGLSYELLFDGIRKEGDYDEVVGTYTENRLGNKKKALSMDGLSEYVKIENHDNINPKNGLTLSIWYKPISFKGSGNDPIIVKPFSSSGAPFAQYHLNVTGNEYIKSKGVFKFGLSINGKYSSIKTAVNTWTPDNWYNITATYDGLVMKLYINGVLKNSRAIEGQLDVYNTDLFIGKNEVKPNKFINTPGTYDNFRIYNRALTKEEVSMLNE